jgi:hypothetical protein
MLFSKVIFYIFSVLVYFYFTSGFHFVLLEYDHHTTVAYLGYHIDPLLAGLINMFHKYGQQQNLQNHS